MPEGTEPRACLQPHQLTFLEVEWLLPPCSCQLLSLRRPSSSPVVPTNSWDGLAWSYVLTIKPSCLPKKASRSHGLQRAHLLSPEFQPSCSYLIWGHEFLSSRELTEVLPSLCLPCAFYQFPLGSDPTVSAVLSRPCHGLIMKSRPKYLHWTVGKQMKSWNYWHRSFLGKLMENGGGGGESAN